jgi:hypothetical protein
MKSITFISALAVLLLLNSCSDDFYHKNKDLVKDKYGLDTKIISGGYAYGGGSYTILSNDGRSSNYLLYNSGSEVKLYTIGEDSKQKPFGVGESIGFTPDTDVLVYTRDNMLDYAFQKANHTEQYGFFSHAKVLTEVLKK